MASFWDKAGGAAKWITDPKQLLTAAGFVLGGPVGAGAGRAVGGMVPQSAGPVPWGALGANTDEFRESTLADGLQWGDVGQAGKDFASGYSAGKVGQQIPGLRDLEGAFGGGGTFSTQAGQATTGTPSVGIGDVTYDPAQQGVPTPGSFEAMKAQVPGAIPQPPDYGLTNLRAPTPQYPAPGAMPQPSALSPMQPPDYGLTNLRAPTPQYPAPGDEGNFLSGAWSRAGDVLGGARSSFDDLTPMEKMYVASQVPGIAGAITGAGGGQPIGEEGTALLGEMGMFSPTQRRRPTNFDEWRSQRSRR